MIPRNLVLATAILSGLFSVPATADVRVRAAVEPETIPHCSTGTFRFALWNTGADSIRVRLTLAIVRADTDTVGPLRFKTSLAPGEVRTREARFIVPPAVPPGSYTLLLGAVASDGTSDHAAARFIVIPSECTPDSPSDASPAVVIEAIGPALGLAEDRPTPVVRDSWGGVKHRFLRKP